MVDAVVLAAGYGSRLSSYINNLPKPLASLNGMPLIEWVLAALENQGPSIRHVVVVTGHRCNVLISHLRAIQENYEFEIVPVINQEVWRGNGASLCAAEGYIRKNPFLLLMGDHVVEPAIIEAALGSRNNHTDVALCTDRIPFFSNRAYDLPTKVFLDENSRIVDIGKRIQRWNCIDTGVFLMTRNIFTSLHSLDVEKLTITGGVKNLIRTKQSVIGVDVSGMFWSDVDTYLDLMRTEEALGESSWGAFQLDYRKEEGIREEQIVLEGE